MNRRKVILSFLLFISLNVFCQSEGETIKIPRSELKEVYEMVKSYKDSLRITKDSLNQCQLIQIDEKSSLLESSTLMNVDEFHALIIAVENYDNLKNLRYPIEDGSKLKEILISDYTFKSENIEFLKDPTKIEIDNILDWYSNETNKKMINSNLLIFYAGHGGLNVRLDDGYWCPSDGNPDKQSSLLRNSSIREYIKLIQARNILLISDACWAGSLMRSTEDYVKINKYQDIYNLSSRIYMSSGVMSEVPDKSTFMSQLVLALKNNKHKYLSASKLFSIISEDVLFQTPRTSEKNVIPQCSYIGDSGHKKGGDFFFIKR